VTKTTTLRQSFVFCVYCLSEFVSVTDYVRSARGICTFTGKYVANIANLDGFGGHQPTPSNSKSKILHVKVGSPLPNFTFIGAEAWDYSPETVEICNFSFLLINLPIRD